VAVLHDVHLAAEEEEPVGNKQAEEYTPDRYYKQEQDKYTLAAVEQLPEQEEEQPEQPAELELQQLSVCKR
jgi:hypothetical protein